MTPSTQETPGSPSPFKSDNGSKTGIVAAVVIALLVAGGVYFYSQKDVVAPVDELMTDEVAETTDVMVSESSAPEYTNEASATPGYMTYTDLTNGFRIDYPETWLMENTSELVHVIFSADFVDLEDLFAENVNITTEDVSWYDGELTLETYGDAAYEQLIYALPDYVLVNRDNMSLGNLDAEFLLGSYAIEGVTLKVLSLYAIENDMVYVLTYTYEDENTDYDDDVEYMINSFGLL